MKKVNPYLDFHRTPGNKLVINPFIFPVSAVGYRATILADNPLAYYRLGELSGTAAADETGNYPATYNGCTLGVTGALYNDSNKSIVCNTGSDYCRNASTLAAAMAGLGAATLEFWYYKVGGSMIGFRTNNYGFMAELNSGDVYCHVENGSGSFPNFNWSGTSVWKHFVLVFNGSLSGAARVAVYVNGSAVTLSTGGASPPATLASAANLGNFTIGGSGFSPGFDEVALYNYALTSGQVAAHYLAGTT